ncbi:MAG: preprotein translocase subunit SecY [Planctomycetota bacterium]
MLKVLRDIMGIPELRQRILLTFGLLAVYRIGFHIYLPYINIDVLDAVIQSLKKSAGEGLIGIILIGGQLTGGNLQNATIFSLGIMPYISASIIFSLLVKVFPRLEALQKEGESGRQQINRYTRYATVFLCLIQALIVVRWLGMPVQDLSPISEGGFFVSCLQILVLTAGTIFLMWLGEKITEYGIGNGVSLIIMAGIIADMPTAAGSMLQQVVADSTAMEERPFLVLKMLILALLFLAVVLGVVYITRAQRRVPIQQARSVKGRRVYGGQRHYMPIRLNSAGVLPIIFAQSLILIPSGLITLIAGQGNWLSDMFNQGHAVYTLCYIALIGFFTYFWTSLMFNATEIAENMKEYGSFIPGIRPGRRTAEYLEQIINRITLAGGTFLAAIALFPQLVTDYLNVQMLISSFLGGTGILIVVGVALDLVDKIEGQLLVRHYEGFMKAGSGSSGGGLGGGGSAPVAKGSSK